MDYKSKTITPAQLKKIQTMFTRIGFEKEDKMNLIGRLTDGRATSTKDITFDEATRLINHLTGKSESQRTSGWRDNQEEARKVVSCIYRIAYDIGMCYGDTPEDKLMNCAKINRFCRERGTVKKNISQMTLQELRKTRRQFESILRKSLDNSVKQLIKNTINQKVTLK